VVEEMFEMKDPKFTDIHNDPKCNKEIIICPKCGHYGHYTRHLNLQKNAAIDLFNTDENTRFYFFHTIMHACFLENKAEGRNQWCYYAEDTVGRDEVYFTVRLKNYENKLPDFVRDRQEGFGDWTSDYDDLYNGGIQDD
jgi:hypothetical protein